MLNLGAGSHSLSLRVIDSSGNTATSAAVTIVITAAVAPPAVNMAAPTANATIALNGTNTVTSVSVSGSATPSTGAAISKLEVLDNGAPTGISSTSGSITTSINLGVGVHPLSLRVTDSTGRTATSASVTITVTAAAAPPTVTMSAPAANASIALTGTNTFTTVSVSGSATPSTGAAISKLEVLNNGAVTGISSTTGSISSAIILGVGAHPLSLRVTDSNGNTATSAAVTITVTSPVAQPTVTMLAPGANASISLTGTNTTTAVSVSGNATPSTGATISKLEVLDNGATTGISSATGSISTAINLGVGVHPLSLHVTDSTGRIATSATVTITVTAAVVAAPTVNMSAPAANATIAIPVTSTTTAVSVSGTATPSTGAAISKLEVLNNGATTGISSTTGSISTTINLGVGVHPLSLHVTDSAGRTATSATVTITVTGAAMPPLPVVRMTTPVSGSTYFTTGTTAQVAVTGDATTVATASITSFDLLDTAGGITTTTPIAGNSVNAANFALSVGVHTLQLRARDNFGQYGYGPSSTVTVSASSAGDSAAYVSMLVPANMRATQPYEVTVTMRNNGTTTWAAGSVYKLGSQSPQDNHIWNPEGRVVVKNAVLPGDQTTFTFTVTAPATPGTYPFVWQMLREYWAWFGQMTPQAVAVNVSAGAGPRAVLSATPTNVRMNGATPATITFTGKGTPDITAMYVSKVELLVDINGADYSATAVKTVIGSGVPAVDLNYSAPHVAGLYRYKLRVTDSNGIVTDSAPVVINVTDSSLLGLISGIRVDASGHPILVGWTCQGGMTQALAYTVYLDAPTPETGGVSLTTGSANLLTEPDSAAVQGACATPGTGHHFNVDLSAYTAQYAGRSLFVTATAATGGAKVSLPCNDNNCTMPGSLRVGLSSPLNNFRYKAGGNAFMEAVVSGAGSPSYNVAFSFDGGTWLAGAADSAKINTFYLNKPALVARATGSCQQRCRVLSCCFS